MKFILYKKFGQWHITDENNYKSRISNARKDKIIDCDSKEEAIDIVNKYLLRSDDELQVIEDNVNESSKKRKKELPTTGLSPILTNPAAGIDTFNNSVVGGTTQLSMSESLGEGVTALEIDGIFSDVVQTTVDFLANDPRMGFGDDATDYCDFDLADVEDSFRIEVRVDISYEGMEMLMEVIDQIVKTVDKYAYFEPVTGGILECYIRKSSADISETFKRMDRERFENDESDLDLYGMYESVNKTLSSEDKSKLKDFVDKTDDVDEINTYLTGLYNKR